MKRGDYKIKTLPVLLPVSIAYVKEHSKVDYADEDTVLAGYLNAAIAEAEMYCNRALMAQTITQKVDCWPTGNIRLFRSPVQSVTHVKYIDTDEAEQTLATTVYGVTSVKEPAEIYLKKDQTWPSTASRPEAIEIEYVAGYADATFVPETTKQAICLLTASHYEKREDYVKKLKTAAESLLDLSMVQGW